MVHARVTILLVDDEDSIRGLAKQVLERRGYEVLVAADSSSALRIADEHPSTIHLLLTDVMMPKGNGLELATAFLQKRPDARVLYMSGFESETIELVESGRATGGRFLSKPFSPRNLIQQVQALVSIEPQEGPAPPQSDGQPIAIPAPVPEAEYTLQDPVRCPHCGKSISTLKAIGLARTEAQDTSTRPQRRVAACPACLALLPVDLTDF